MKRYVSILVLVLFIFTLAVPCAAADNVQNENLFNVLDYCTPNNSGGILATVPYHGTVEFDMGVNVPFYGFDCVIAVSGAGVPTNPRIEVNNTFLPLTLITIGPGLYRLYSSNLYGYAKSTFRLWFDNTDIMYVGFQTCKIKTVNVNVFTAASALRYSINAGTFKTKANAGSTVSTESFGSSAIHYPYAAYVDLTDWKKYDYMEFYLEVNANSIDSIVASHNNKALPFSVSIYEMSSDGSVIDSGSFDVTDGVITSNGSYIDTEIGSGEYSDDVENGFTFDSVIDGLWGTTEYYFKDPNNTVFIYVTVDLRGVDRSLDAVPTVFIRGTGALRSNNKITQSRCSGYIEVNSVSPLNKFFSSVTDLLKKLIGGSEDGASLSNTSGSMEVGFNKVQTFEESNAYVFEENFDDVTVTIDNGVGSFGTALRFLQQVINQVFIGLGDVSIIYYLPLFLGLFFFICSRVPGAISGATSRSFGKRGS